jgi:hypothetical protein
MTKRKCECGGKLKYTRDFGMVFVYCVACTPVVPVVPPGMSRRRVSVHRGSREVVIRDMACALEDLIALAETAFPPSDLLDSRLALDAAKAVGIRTEPDEDRLNIRLHNGYG